MSTVPFRIIRARSHDRPAISRLIRSAKIASGFDGSLRNCWIAIAGDAIVGCASLVWHGPHTVILTHCVVRREFRHRGIGTFLVKRRLDEAHRRGKRLAALCTMYYQFRHYKKLGFRTVPRAHLPASVRDFSQFTAKRYMKCAVMLRVII